MPIAREHRERAEGLVAQMRGMVDTAKKQNRAFTSAEREKYDNMRLDFDACEEKIKKAEGRSFSNGPRIAEFMEHVNQVHQYAGGRAQFNNAARMPLAVDRQTTDELRDRYRRRPGDEDDSPHARAFTNYLRRGMENLDPDDAAEMRSHFVSGLSVRNAQSTSGGSQGGFIVPTGFSGMLEQAKKWFGGIDGPVEKFHTSTGNPWPWPTTNDTTNMGRIIGQNVQLAETDFSFGQVTFNSYIFSSDIVLIPLALVEDSYFNIDALCADLLGTRLGRLFNLKMTQGTGSGEPYGIVPAVVATGAVMQLPTGSTAAISYNNLVDLEHSVDPSYRNSPSSFWMFSDGMLKLIKKLQDGNGRPLWQPGLSASFQEGASVDLMTGNPTILGHRYIVNSNMDVPAANAVSILFGDMSAYKVREIGEGPSILRLTERYADYLQLGILGWERSDGNLIDAGTHPIWGLRQSAT